jgi:hypothetical protein
MLSCREICKSLSNFEGEQTFKLENHNVLFEQSIDFAKKYLELVEDKIKENGWIDPNLNPEKFKQFKKDNKDTETNETETESKPVESQNENKESTCTYLNYKIHQTVNLPEELLKVIDKDRHDELYYYGMKGPDSFLASVLLAVETNYWLQHRKKKSEYADQIKTTFSIQKHDILRDLSKESKGNDYIAKINSSDFPEHVDSDKSIELQFLICYNFKINLLIIDLKDKTGSFASDWDTNKNTVVLIKDNLTFLPILSNKLPYFTSEEIMNFKNEFNILFPIKMQLNDDVKGKGRGKSKAKNTETASDGQPLIIIMKAEQLESEDMIKNLKPEQILPLAKYQLKDLQEIAEKLCIETEHKKYGGDAKTIKLTKKTKKDLHDDILEKIKNKN